MWRDAGGIGGEGGERDEVRRNVDGMTERGRKRVGGSRSNMQYGEVEGRELGGLKTKK